MASSAICTGSPTILYSTSAYTYLSTHYTTVRATGTVARPTATSGSQTGDDSPPASTMLTLSDVETLTGSTAVPTRTIFNCETQTVDTPTSTPFTFSVQTTTSAPKMTTSTLVTALSLPVTTPGNLFPSIQLVTVTAYVEVTPTPAPVAALDPDGPPSSSPNSSHSVLAISLSVTLVSVALIALFGFLFHRYCGPGAARRRDEDDDGDSKRRGRHPRRDQELWAALKAGRIRAGTALDDVFRVAQRGDTQQPQDDDYDDSHHSSPKSDSASGSSGHQHRQNSNPRQTPNTSTELCMVEEMEEEDLVQPQRLMASERPSGDSAAATALHQRAHSRGTSSVLEVDDGHRRSAEPRKSNVKVTAPVDRFGFINVAFNTQGHGDNEKSFSSAVFSSLQDAVSADPIGGGVGGKAIEGEPPSSASRTSPASSNAVGGFFSDQRKRLSAVASAMMLKRSATGSFLGYDEHTATSKRDSLKRHSTSATKRLSSSLAVFGSRSEKVPHQSDMVYGGGVPAVSDLVQSSNALALAATSYGTDSSDAYYVNDMQRYSGIVLPSKDALEFLATQQEECEEEEETGTFGHQHTLHNGNDQDLQNQSDSRSAETAEEKGQAHDDQKLGLHSPSSQQDFSLLSPSHMQDGPHFYQSTTTLDGATSSIALTRSSSASSMSDGPTTPFTPGVNEFEQAFTPLPLKEDVITKPARALSMYQPVQRSPSPAIVLSSTAQAEVYDETLASEAGDHPIRRTASHGSRHPKTNAPSSYSFNPVRPDSFQSYGRPDSMGMYLDPMHGYMYSRSATPTWDQGSVIASSPTRHSVCLPPLHDLASSPPLPAIPQPASILPRGATRTRSGSTASQASADRKYQHYPSAYASRPGSPGSVSRRSIPRRPHTGDDGLPPSLYAHLDLPVPPPRDENSLGGRPVPQQTEDTMLLLDVAATTIMEEDSENQDPGASRPTSPLRRSGRFSPINFRKLAEPFFRSASPIPSQASLSPMILPVSNLDTISSRPLSTTSSRAASLVATHGTTSPLAVLVETLAMERSKSVDGGSVRDVAEEMAREWERELAEQPTTSSEGHAHAAPAAAAVAPIVDSDSVPSAQAAAEESMPKSSLDTQQLSRADDGLGAKVSMDVQAGMFPSVPELPAKVTDAPTQQVDHGDESDGDDSVIDGVLADVEEDTEKTPVKQTIHRRGSHPLQLSTVSSPQFAPLALGTAASFAQTHPQPRPQHAPTMPLPISKDRLSWSGSRTGRNHRLSSLPGVGTNKVASAATQPANQRNSFTSGPRATNGAGTPNSVQSSASAFSSASLHQQLLQKQQSQQSSYGYGPSPPSTNNEDDDEAQDEVHSLGHGSMFGGGGVGGAGDRFMAGLDPARSDAEDDDGSVSHLSHVGELLWRQTMGALAIANANAGDFDAESAMSHHRRPPGVRVSGPQ
ncbi:hypothetical protein A4X13_0g2961 [Tilletia indica]|uniref:Uncharacterized protein n=1 Tax=Tilletia indica TaxID=43049 RepID=A0A177TNP8_9BASI|nr:hypothetical protein A4X13_0g2961 [Tilletia indica]